MVMSETATALPPFFNRVVGVNPAIHGQLRLDREAGFGFAAGAQSVPLGLGEFDIAARHYPILFTTGADPMPVALLGLNDAGNLFVRPDGSWRPDSYVPACLRAWPFIFVEDEAAARTFVGMEPDAACLGGERGQRLFEDGTPTAVLNDAIAFCSAYRDNLLAAGAFARALDEAGVLADEEATVNFTAGGGTQVRGFKVVRAERLDAVPDETFLDWRRRGWIGVLYAHLQSAGQWSRLIDLAAARL
jgi:hypothetical protein